MNEYIVGVDIGSSKICAAAGKYDKYGKLQIRGITSVSYSGMKNGVIVDMDNTANAIKNCIKQLEGMVDTQVLGFYISLPSRIGTLVSNRGVVAVASDDREISQKDVKRVINAAKIVKVPTDKEIIGVIPKQYIIDGYDKIKDPVGMSASRLEVDSYVILAESTVISNLFKTVEKAGYEVLGMVFQPMADAEVVLKKEEMDLGCALVNIGADSIDISIYKDEKLSYTSCINIGGNSITNDIAICLKLPFSEAEKLKIKYGIIGIDNLELKDSIKVNLGYNNVIKINSSMLLDVIEARAEELLKLIMKNLKESGQYSQISGIVIAGGGLATIKGIEELGEYVFKKPVRVGTPDYVGAINPAYVSAVGTVRDVLNTMKANKSNNNVEDEAAVACEETSKKTSSKQKGPIIKIKEFLTEFFE
ncbi:cell division protein FtsA [Clostridium oceanicum]|uniref:Cell division protein FtsA n=1 Tax=Clostridium oceanicum TaxID=1543 RepID=A0ABN1JB46_9CLOT